jgi:hypothetical protein
MTTEPEACPEPGRRVARAIAFFDRCLDVALLRKGLADAAPRAAQQVRRQIQRRGEDSIPSPANLSPAVEAATEAEALRVLATTNELALLEALTRAIGRRIEALTNPPNTN